MTENATGRLSALSPVSVSGVTTEKVEFVGQSG